MHRTFILSAAAACLLTTPALADITIFDSPGSVNPDENVLFQGPDPIGNMAFGVTNQTATEVTFLGTEPLVTPSKGQARLEAADGGFSSMQFFLSDSLLGFTEVEFNIRTDTATSVTLNFTDQFGAIFSDSFNLGPGQNFFSALATNNQLISNVSFTLNGDAADLRQVRIGGISETGVIPEPATWAMMIAGFGMVGATMRRRKVMPVLS